jgi:hypothetical protein
MGAPKKANLVHRFFFAYVGSKSVRRKPLIPKPFWCLTLFLSTC